MEPRKILVPDHTRFNPWAAEGLPNNSADWAHTVECIIPHLDTDGVQEALSIMDMALNFAQQATALREIQFLAHSREDDAARSLRESSKRMLGSIVSQQQSLLVRLQQLRFRCLADPVPVVGSSWDYEETVRKHDANSPRVVRSSLIGSACDILNVANTIQSASRLNPEDSRRFSVGESVGSISAARTQQTLSSSLQALGQEDPACLIVVRRINKLRFMAIRMLKKHFGKFGPVVRVLMAHSTVRQVGEEERFARRRPSSLGFVQMGNASAVQAILAHGREQDVDGFIIHVQKFEQHNLMKAPRELGFDDFVDTDTTTTMPSEAAYSSTASSY
eukprot:TRINITY_DN9242_c0_g1_i1.p1 TRINITY_DN9242_c0_g1~~TRINITY_DN9242_c0_g1_i1.p1  ORF type:complete len:379 (+),score=44.52 TRINITY_DN9242_c0_g1_i1:140-1138(+)